MPKANSNRAKYKKHFIIQRSFNGRDYANIGRVQWQANSNLIQYYSYEEADLLYINRQLSSANSISYRLQVFDKDGSFIYRPVE